jgi:hypothetical protein
VSKNSSKIAMLSLIHFSTVSAQVDFDVHRIDTVRGESICIFDVDQDGALDIVSTNHWYGGPDWTPTQFRNLQVRGGQVSAAGVGQYENDFDVPLDLDHDGDLDVITASWGTPLRWYENVPSGLWPVKELEGTVHNYHTAELWDIDGDGKAEEMLTGKTNTSWWEVSVDSTSSSTWLDRHVISSNDKQWGYGAGDIDGDGRTDIIRGNAWYEAPADPRAGTWKEHCLSLAWLQDVGHVFPVTNECGSSEHAQQIWVSDVNGDGLNDLIAGAAHTYGLFWYEQEKNSEGISFIPHEIDHGWSQVHALSLADLDLDGDLDVVTGKRWRAHGGGDPGARQPNGMYWYEFRPGKVDPWTKHIISYDNGVGAGNNVGVADLDEDGDLDIVVTTKEGGPYLLENRLDPAAGQ